MDDAAPPGHVPPIPNHRVEIRLTPSRGRGVFAREAIASGTVIEAAPVIILPAAQCSTLDRTIIHNYYFHWDGDPDGDGRGALGLGLVTMCNHSTRPCARVDRNYAQQTLDLTSTTPIEPGQEITIDYGCPLWFEPCE
ncbi:MAG: SET domain-containing protein-lysine N-methyltransferase [Alphaproteobacteria bacterium]|nr:SET domain-containing protein-lysine N-methyltransferase [Alphaproteobacteria bacterium]